MSRFRCRSAHGWQVVAQLRRLLVALALALLAVCTATSSAAARENGLATAGCTGCHSGGRDTQVTITPSSNSVGLGQKITLSIAVQAVNGRAAGLYFTSTSGVGRLTVVDGQTKSSGTNSIVHSSPKVGSSATITFTVDWTAPNQPGGVEFNAYVISANDDGRSSGDGAGAGFLSIAFGCAGTRYYADRDGDGDGVAEGEYRMACSQPMYFSPTSTDCDDNDERVHTGAPELCNGRDDDCDKMIDEGLTFTTYCEDKDGDGHGVRGATIMACGVSKGFGLCDDDCDDNDPTIHPAAQELCNYRDDNCNGRVDEDAKLSCGEGWCRRYSESCTATACTPGEPRVEECNAFDDDCDGVIDNDAPCPAGQRCSEGSCRSGVASDAGAGALDGGTNDGGVQADAHFSDDGLGASNGGCRVGPSSMAGWWLLLALGVLRRRRTG